MLRDRAFGSNVGYGSHVLSVTSIGALFGILAASSPGTGPMKIARQDTVLFRVVPDDRTDLVRIARDVLEGLTRLTLQTPRDIGLDPQVLDRCEGPRRFSCWLDAVRERRPEAAIAYLVTLTIHGEGALDRLAVMTVDVEAAQARRADVDRSDSGWEEELENTIFEEAVVVEVGQIPRGEPPAAVHFFETLFGERLGQTFEQRGHWAPNGAVSLRTDRPDLEIRLDGRPIGRTIPGEARIEGLREGSRTLTLMDGSEKIAEAKVEIVRGQTTSVEAILGQAPRETPWKGVTMWSGVGLAAAGAAVTVWSLTASGDVTYASCADPGCSGSERSFTRLGGALAAPLGYSLAVAGISSSLGTLLVDEDELLWVPVLVGVVLGSLSYGLSAVLD